MKINDSILIKRADGCIVAAIIIQLNGGSVVARPFSGGSEIYSAPLKQCVTLADAFEMVHQSPELTAALAAALEAGEKLSAQLGQSNEGLVDTSKLLEAANARLAEKSELLTVTGATEITLTE